MSNSDTESHETSSSSEDENIDEEFEKRFIETFTALKTGKISEIKNISNNEISNELQVPSNENDLNVDKNKKLIKSKPIYLKDYEIDLLLNQKDIFDGSEIQHISKKKTLNKNKTSSELNIIKRINQKSEAIQDDDLFIVKDNSNNEEESNCIPSNILEEKDENTQFLKDYVFNKRYICSKTNIEKEILRPEILKEDENVEEDTPKIIYCPRNLPSSRTPKTTRSVKKKKQLENKIKNKKIKLETLKKENYKKNKELINKIKAIEGECDAEEHKNKDSEFEDDESIEESEQKLSKRKLKKLKRIEKNKKKVKKEDEIDLDKIDEDLVDEYCHMDYEDIIDDTPVRFNYRKVQPASYGLTPEEILLCDDKELNKWCSLKKVISYNDEDEEKKLESMYKRRIKNHKMRNRILSSLYNPESKNKIKKSKTKNIKILQPIAHSNRDRLIKRFFNQAKTSVVDKMPTDRLLAYNLQKDTKYTDKSKELE